MVKPPFVPNRVRAALKRRDFLRQGAGLVDLQPDSNDNRFPSPPTPTG